MMKARAIRFYISVFSLALGVASGSALAEGGCPPGQVPKQFGQVIGCAPGFTIGPSSQPPEQQEPAQWVSRWGAIADNGGSVYGIAEEKSSESEAAEAAMEDCKARGGELGGKQCVLGNVYRNACAAIAAGERTSAIVYEKKEKKAIREAMKLCKKKNSKCRVYYSACSLPVLVKLPPS